MNPSVSRRDFLSTSARGMGAGTAFGALLGLGANLAPATVRAQQLRIKDAKATPSVCPYCAVGCGTIVRTIGNDIVNIEGDPRSPHSEGCLCPKGAATYQLHMNPNRATKVLHRKPGATRWEEVELDRAMDRVATAGQEDPGRDVRGAARGRHAGQRDHGDLRAGRRHAGQRVEPHPAEADARARRRRDREPGPNMTLLQRPRSGDQARTRRGDHVPAQHGALGLHRVPGLQHGGVPPGRVPLAHEGEG